MAVRQRLRPVVMGVVNVTPDSFSDGGRWLDRDAAVAHAVALVAAGASILDVGGESTRPGAARPEVAEELRRVVPVVADLAAMGYSVSVDTMRSQVAEAALDAGAVWVNDVSGGLADPRMVDLAREAGVTYVAMHWRGHSHDMQTRARYGDVVGEVLAELGSRVEALERAGLRRDRIVIDPGLGFAKTAAHNWELLRALGRFVDLPYRVLVGASRKAFLGAVGRAPGRERAPQERDVATAVVSAHAAIAGVWGIRVHDVTGTVDALDVTEALDTGKDLT